jgi:hypothetical protein
VHVPAVCCAHASLPRGGAVYAPAEKISNGWAIDTSDGHLRILHNGEQKLVLHNEEDGSGVWTKEMGWLRDRLVKDGDPVTIRCERWGNRLQATDDYKVDGYHKLPRPATWSNANRGEWERLVVERL